MQVLVVLTTFPVPRMSIFDESYQGVLCYSREMRFELCGLAADTIYVKTLIAVYLLSHIFVCSIN